MENLRALIQKLFTNPKYDVFVWASDFENFRGEGVLARSFLEKILNNNDKIFYIKTPGDSYLIKKKKILLLKKKKFKLNFFNKYIIIYFGIFYIWINFFIKKKIIYLNYLPLWNPLIFLLLPRSTLLGPVTGGSHYRYVNIFEKFIRKFIFLLLYKISLYLLYYKFKRAVFSTNLLNKYVPNYMKKYFIFYGCLLTYLFRNNVKNKKIDFLIYYKNTSTKNPIFFRSIIQYLIKNNFSVYVVGDYLKIPKVKNLQTLSRNKLLSFLEITSFTIVSNENFYSIFCLDCISSHVKIFYDLEKKSENIFFDKKMFFSIPINDLNNSLEKIKKVVRERKKIKTIKLTNNKKLFNQIKKIEKYIKSLSDVLL